MSFSNNSSTSLTLTLTYKVSSGKTLTKGPWEQKPKQPTMLAVTLSSKPLALINSLNLSMMTCESADKQPVPPQTTMALWPGSQWNFFCKQAPHFSNLAWSSFSDLICSILS